MRSFNIVLILPVAIAAFTTPKFSTKATLSLSAAPLSRSDFLVAAGQSTAFLTLLPRSALADDDTSTLPNGVVRKILKKGDGAAPDIGQLAAIRFKAYQGSTKIDDIFDSPEPYYTRVGSGGMIKGVEEALPLMRLGDRWELTIPGKLAFGPKGRPASAGKPRIPGDATIVFEIEMVGVPGKEAELIDLIGDD